MELKFRMYKNNVYGVKYKKYYIVPRDNKSCDVLDDKLFILREGFIDKEDAAWFIDKMTATEEELKVLNLLYSKEIYELTDIMMKYYGKSDPASKYIYEMARRIRDRKDVSLDWE